MEARQDGEQVDDCPETVGIVHERVFALPEAKVGSNPTEYVIDDEDGRRKHLYIEEVSVMLPEHERNDAQDDDDEHADIIEMTQEIRTLINFDNLV
jgi:hypothetical protein